MADGQQAKQQPDMAEQLNQSFAELGKAFQQIGQTLGDALAAQQAITAMLRGIYEDAGSPYGTEPVGQQRWYREHAEHVRQAVAEYRQQRSGLN